MSFVKKAVKKVFKFVKKVVKSKIFKWVAIAAVVFFTAGVAAGGFASFAGVTGIPSFFVAVGQTIATGAASIASGLGFKGLSGSLASKGGAAAVKAGLTAVTTLGPPASVAASGITKAITAASKAVGSKSGLWKGIAAAATALLSRQRPETTFVAGGLSRGGSAELGPQPFFVVGGSQGSAATQAGDETAQLGGTTAAQPPATPDDSSAPQASPLFARAPQQRSGGLLSLPDPVAENDTSVTGTPTSLEPSRLADNSIGSRTPEERFFGEFRSTNIEQPRDRRSFEERIFGGTLAGV